MQEHIVWFVGKNIGDRRCELQGIFTTREKAVSACRKPEYFVMPVVLDKGFPDETVPASEYEYPLA